MFKKITGITLLGITLFSCSKKTIAPATEAKPTEQATVEFPAEITEGKTLYENHCANCHKLFPTTKHDKAGWAKTVDRMARKAKISEDQKALIYHYLTYQL